MSKIFADISLSIGNTPLVRLNRITDGAKGIVLVKVESCNPTTSVKCRIGAALIWDAQKRGLLTHGKHLVEPTSGNTGIALAAYAATRGIPITLTMSESMSIERRKILISYGANIVLTPASEGTRGAVKKAKEIVESDPQKYLMLNQFENPANPAIHEQTTGPEIWNDTEGKIDIFVAGVGTGGTITGVSRYIKNTCGKKITTIAVEPAASPVLTQHRNGEELKPQPHQFQGMGAGFIPKTLDMSIIDEIIPAHIDEAIIYARRLAKEEGIIVGLSSGAATAVAIKLAQKPENAGKTIVVILPDSGERYLSTILFEGML